MNKKMIWLLKYIAIYLGIKEFIGLIAFKVAYPLMDYELDVIQAIMDTSSVIAVLFVVFIYKIERTEAMKYYFRPAKKKKDKLKKLLLLIITLGIILLIYKKLKKKELSF